MLEVGDGIARVYGLSGVMAGEMVEFTRTGVRGLAFNLEENSVGVIILGDYLEIIEGDEVRTTGDAAARAGRRRPHRPGRRSARQCRSTARARSSPTSTRPVESIAPGVAGRQPVNQPLQTGIKAIDSMTPDRPRPARADHRRPQDRQDRHRHRHHHQPARRERHLRLRRHRPEGIDRGQRGRKPARATGPWTTPSSSSPRPPTPAPLQYVAPYAGTRHGRVLTCTSRAATRCASTTT